MTPEKKKPKSASENNLEIRYDLKMGSFNTSVDLIIPLQGITAVFGASGSGKTTLLRMITGLDKCSESSIRFRGQVWQDNSTYLAAHKRPIGYVFQEASLFPHLSVQKNLLYGWNRTPKPERKIQFADAVDLLGLSDLLTRMPAKLSGGQRQRVAMARAILRSPQLLLMDEPLSSLDNESKTAILPYLQSLQKTFHLPIIYVSHSAEEIARIADTIVLLEKGRVTAMGEINQILTDPTLPLSKLEEACSVIDGTCDSHDDSYHLTYLDLGVGKIAIELKDISIGQPVRIRVLARDVSISLEHHRNTSISNIFPATVMDISDAIHPSQVIITLKIGANTVLSRITQRSLEVLKLKMGAAVFAQIKSVSLMR